MMDQDILPAAALDEKQYECVLCSWVPEYPMTSQCCGAIFCESCLQQLHRFGRSTCPCCRDGSPRYQANTYLLRLISKARLSCRFGCGYIAQGSEVRIHQLSCPTRPMTCNKCFFTSSKSLLIQHCVEKHENELLHAFTKNIPIQIPIIKVQSNLNGNNGHVRKIDTTGEVKNSVGHVSVLGNSTKFYCGQPSGHQCQECDGTCGPFDGCNCPPCMELDIQFRNLPKGCLINCEGRTAKFEDNTFSCGQKIDEFIVCGQGAECSSCFSLLLDLRYYEHLLV